MTAARRLLAAQGPVVVGHLPGHARCLYSVHRAAALGVGTQPQEWAQLLTTDGWHPQHVQDMMELVQGQWRVAP